MNSAPQSTHFRTLSVNSMAGFPEGGNAAEIGHDLGCAGPVSLSSYVVQHKGPGPHQIWAAKIRPAFRSEKRVDIAPSPDGAEVSAITNRCTGRYDSLRRGRYGSNECVKLNVNAAIGQLEPLPDGGVAGVNPALCEPFCDSACAPAPPSRDASHPASGSRSDA